VTPVPHSRPWITGYDRAAVDAVLRTGTLASGEHTAAFEAAAAGPGASGVSTTSGTAALRLALTALGVGPGDEVVLPTYVCFDVAAAVLSVGARPVPADVGEHWLMGPDEVRPRLTARTRAIIAVHIFGLCAPVAGLAALGLPVVVDACQAFTAGRGSPEATAGATAWVTSFHATKCLTTGAGGLVASPDPAFVDAARAARARGVADPLSDLAAALGSAQLALYPEFLARRGGLAEVYAAEGPEPLTTRWRAAPKTACIFRFPLSAPGLAERTPVTADHRGVCLRRGVDALVHRTLGLPDADFPRAVRHLADTVSLPLYPSLEKDEVDRVLAVAATLA
jgi:perosamine synthetase